VLRGVCCWTFHIRDFSGRALSIEGLKDGGRNFSLLSATVEAQ
jgi:hypothetical protein